MSYSYYQQAQPGWGTNQFQFGPPPTPNFQSQPSWGGMDFYRAHALSPDPSLFDHAWNRVRDFTGLGGMDRTGVGMHEARHWHRRAYGGIGELNMMLPAEIGHAAAYEAFRTWVHNSSIYEPLSGDISRQREGLIGLAVAEASRLLPYAGRQMDNYARMEASEAAAETASFLFYQNREEMMGDEYRSRSQYGGSTYGGDPYAYDDARFYPRRRSRSRRRSHSRHRSQPIIIQGGGGYSSPMPGSFPGGGYAGSMPPGVNPSFGGQSGSYGSYGERVPMPIHGTPYPASAGGMGMGGMGGYPSSSMTDALPIGGYHRGRSTSMSYPQQPYMGAAVSSGGMMMPGAPPGQTIVIKPRHKHKHHRHRSHGRRSRSSDRYDYRY